MSDFDDSNLFQSQKQLSVNTEYQLKSKLTWLVCPNSMKSKQVEQEQCLQLKMLLLLGYNLKIVVQWGVGGG